MSAVDGGGARWWTTSLATLEDPISLEPLRKLRYPPFKLPTDPSLAHTTDSDWFDGHILANYLVSTASFVHPISRRDITREECVALDAYCTECVVAHLSTSLLAIALYAPPRSRISLRVSQAQSMQRIRDASLRWCAVWRCEPPDAPSRGTHGPAVALCERQ